MLQALASAMRAAVAALRNVVWEVIRGADGIVRLVARTVDTAAMAIGAILARRGTGGAAAEQVEEIGETAAQATEEIKEKLAVETVRTAASEEEIVSAAAKAMAAGRTPKGISVLNRDTQRWLAGLSGLEVAIVAKADVAEIRDHLVGFKGLPCTALVREPVPEFDPGNPAYDGSHFPTLPVQTRERLLAAFCFQREAESAPEYRPTMH